MFYRNSINLYKDLILNDARIPQITKDKIKATKETPNVNADEVALKQEIEALDDEVLKEEYKQKWDIVVKHIDNAMGVN